MSVRMQLLVALAIAATLSGCTAGAARTPKPPASTPSRTTPAPSPTHVVTQQPVAMRAWHGPIEELFVHPLVINPKLAFTSDTLGVGFQNNFVTALEFQRILDQLWANGWTLVDVHRAAAGTVRVPVGRKPLVFSEDDVNYYHYFDGRGLADRLVLAGDEPRAELPGGTLTDQDVVPMVDAEVAKHPEFSADGARGVVAVTGYEGLFGEHNTNDPKARARLKALAHWLKTHGWTIASHTWGHINLTTNSLGSIAWDTAHWKALAEPLLGPTDVLIYPFGARPTAAGIRQLVNAGYKIQLDIDIHARHELLDGAIVMSRRHIDGYAFEAPARQAPFFDVATVLDPQRPR